MEPQRDQSAPHRRGTNDAIRCASVDGNLGDDQKIKQSSSLGEVKADLGMPIDLNTGSNYSNVLWLQKRKKEEEIESAAQTESGEGNLRSRFLNVKRHVCQRSRKFVGFQFFPGGKAGMRETETHPLIIKNMAEK